MRQLKKSRMRQMEKAHDAGAAAAVPHVSLALPMPTCIRDEVLFIVLILFSSGVYIQAWDHSVEPIGGV